MLGYCYAHGNGVDIDQLEVLIWFTVAAENGKMNSKYELGHYLTERVRINAVGLFQEALEL